MTSAKKILIVTAPVLDGIKIIRYIKPISAHIVTGTNLFSDIAASFTDVFGGRSQSYQRQIAAIYDEAIDKLKIAAFELGANCVIDLKIDADEIAGKGKSMFMLTAIGTAVVTADTDGDKKQINAEDNIVSFEEIAKARLKKDILTKAKNKTLVYDDEFWSFVSSNQVAEVFPYILTQFEQIGRAFNWAEMVDRFHNSLVHYVDSFPENVKRDLIYSSITMLKHESLINKMLVLIYSTQLLDFDKLEPLIKNADFDIQKKGIAISVYDKPYYSVNDITKLTELRDYIQSNFNERGKRTSKKQLLSSKEKEVWECECGKINDGYGIDEAYCENCQSNIWGFKQRDVKPSKAVSMITEKLAIISDLIS